MNTNFDDQAVLTTQMVLGFRNEAEIRLINPLEKDPTRRVKTVHVKNAQDFLEVVKTNNGLYNVYVGINERRIGGTKAEDVIFLRNFHLDIDAVRPKDAAPERTGLKRPATEEELKKAEVVADKIIVDVVKDGFISPIKICSGNGYQLWFSFPEIEVDDSNRKILEAKVQRLTQYFIDKYSTKEVRLDQIGDLPRIIRVPGTKNILSDNRLSTPITSFERREDSKLREKILSIKEASAIIEAPKLEAVTQERMEEILEGDKKLKDLLHGLTGVEGEARDKQLGFDSRSEADMSVVCRLINKLTKEQVFKIMLRRDKWNEALDQYRELTYKKASEKYNIERIGIAEPKYSKYITRIDGKKVFQYDVLIKDILSNDKYATDMETEFLYVYSNGVWSRKIVTPTLKLKSALFTEQKLTSHQFNELVFHLKNETFVSGDVFDKNPYLVNLENGVYDLQGSEFREHNPHDYLVQQLPISYDPQAKCVKFEKFIKDITAKPEDAIILQKLFGYFLVKHSKEQKFFILEGGGANGKSKLIGVAHALLGQANTVALTLSEIEKNRFSRSRLYQKLANLCGDLSYEELSYLGTIKRLTGEDWISAEKKGKDGFDFLNYSKQVFLANRIPKMGEDTVGVWRRIVLLNFPHKFEKDKLCLVCNIEHEVDKDLLDKLLTELPGILNWAIEGYKILQADPFKPVEREAYLKKSDPLKLFLEDMVVPDPEGKPLKTEVFGGYVVYCKSLSMAPMSEDSFWKRVRKEWGQKLDIRKIYELDGNPRAWFGVTLKKDNQLNQDNQPFSNTQLIQDIYINREEGKKVVKSVKLATKKSEVEDVSEDTILKFIQKKRTTEDVTSKFGNQAALNLEDLKRKGLAREEAGIWEATT